ncbi:Nonribosomal peptide synthase roqA [Penicillium rolfsii]|nr:Nonribosomal peptide synthase roqA [Penicillium rolfsii]
MEKVMREIITKPDQAVDELEVCSDEDFECIQSWNISATQWEVMPKCVHEEISRKCCQQPNQPAIIDSEGQITYLELDRYSSIVESRLLQLGVGPGLFVPLCYHKSRWATVAALGVLKAGGAYVFLDPSHPLRRNKSVCNATASRIALCSSELAPLMESLNQHAVVIDSSWVSKGCDMNPAITSPACNPSSAMYIVFTSGSTGEPKGIVTEHGAFFSKAQANGRALSLGSQTKMLQFASYTFDVSNRDVFMTLLFGGCIYVPSESERVDRLADFISRFKVNCASLTPSIASTLSPDEINLDTLILGGEPLSQSIISTWADRVRLVNAYGVSESAGIVSLASSVSPISSPRNIGFGCGSAIWIVDKENTERLLPIGAAGEIVIQGAGLARGYLSKSERTAHHFLDRAKWQPRVKLGESSLDQRYYRTGDLGRYNLDGSIEYIGRKDDQIKFNGQRLEPTEIEHQILSWRGAREWKIQNAAVIATPRPVQLLSFLGLGSSFGIGHQEGLIQPAEAQKIITDLVAHLSLCIPQHIIPVKFAFLPKLPLNKSGKVNRCRLREMYQELMKNHQGDLFYLRDDNADTDLTHTPHRASHISLLQDSWCEALESLSGEFQLRANFFGRGGNSITAIRLVALLRRKGYRLRVADIFKFPTLSRMASMLREIPHSELEQKSFLPPFSLVKDDPSILSAVLLHLGLPPEQVEDVYPCTPIQEGIFALSTQSPGAYIGRYSWKLPIDIDLLRFQASWESIWRMNPILRTRIVETSNGAYQVVLRGTLPWQTVANDEPERPTIEAGQLLRCIIQERSQSSEASRYSFILDIHHALFDDWSLHIILEQVEQAYSGQILEPRPFNTFVKYVHEAIEQYNPDFWRHEHLGLEAEHFPARSAERGNEDGKKSVLEHTIDWDPLSNTEFTTASILRLGWALVLRQETGCDDVIFGSTVTGRNASMPEIDRVSGPTLATSPVRVTLDFSLTVNGALEKIQDQFSRMIPHEQIGLQRIRQAGPESAVACGFQNLLLVQPDYTAHYRLFAERNTFSNITNFTGYPLLLVCNLKKDLIHLQASFDEGRVATETVRRMLRQMDHICQQIRLAGGLRLIELDWMTSSDKAVLQKWNNHIPETTDACIHDLIQIQCQTHPERVAVEAHDITLTFGEVEDLASHFASRLREAGVKSGTFVPLLSEKSGWATIALLGILKSGAALVMLETTYPTQRLKAICSEVQAEVIVSSEACAYTSSQIHPRVVVIGHLTGRHGGTEKQIPPSVSPKDPAFVVFTSGTTGQPKGIVVHHSAISSSARLCCKRMLIGPDSRVYQFSSYAFDASVGETLFSLLAGACLCVPSDRDRKTDPAKAARDLRVNWAFLTPSVISLMDPLQIPTLRTLCSGGEPITAHIVREWANHLNLINGYGPAECSVFSNAQGPLRQNSDIGQIGRGFGAVCWIVDRNDHTKLVPLGTVGELLLEGPIVGMGYLNDPMKTEASFIRSPSWLCEFRAPLSPGRLYKTGDLVSYSTEGSLRLHGRKDLQVKLSGQRLDLGEVESRLNLSSKILDSVVEAVKLDGRSLLMAFIRPVSIEAWTGPIMDDLTIIEDPNEAFFHDSMDVATMLQETLPPYMTPSVYIPIAEFPLTLTGKLNRRLLRDHVMKWTPSKFQKYNRGLRESDDSHAPQTDRQRRILQLVADILGLDQTRVRMSSNFFALGGDSITAMRLAVLARKEGIQLNVPDIFSQPTLSSLADQLETDAVLGKRSMCKDHDHFLLETLKKYRDVRSSLSTGISENLVGILPANEFQKMTMASFYNRYICIPLSLAVDQARLRDALQAVVGAHSMLRTGFFRHSRAGLMQIIARSVQIRFEQHNDVRDLDEFCANDSLAMPCPTDGTIGFQPLLVTLKVSSSFLVLRLPHAYFDPLSLLVLCQDLSTAYAGKPLPPTPQFSEHLQSIATSPRDSAYRLWRSTLSDVSMTSLKNFQKQHTGDLLTSNGHQASGKPLLITATEDLLLFAPPPGITLATVVKAAWAITLMQRITSNSDVKDVVFGQVSHARNLGLPNEERIIGPCGNIIPVCVRFSESPSLQDVLCQVQEQHIALMQAENLGYQEIVRECTPWPAETPLGSFVRVLTFDATPPCIFGGVKHQPSVFSLPNLPSSTANVLAVPHDGLLSITMTISDRVMDQDAANDLLRHFGVTLQRFTEKGRLSEQA